MPPLKNIIWEQYRRAGIRYLCFHNLRATCITEWLEQGMKPHEVMRLAGHSSIETTMNYYVGIRDTMIERALAASQRAFGQEVVTL